MAFQPEGQDARPAMTCKTRRLPLCPQPAWKLRRGELIIKIDSYSLSHCVLGGLYDSESGVPIQRVVRYGCSVVLPVLLEHPCCGHFLGFRHPERSATTNPSQVFEKAFSMMRFKCAWELANVVKFSMCLACDCYTVCTDSCPFLF